MRAFFLILIVVPLVELYLLIQFGSVVGALPTVLLTVLTAVIGVVLMRSQGVATLQNAQQQMATGDSPQQAMFEGVFIFLGGVLLFLPGLVTDSLGLLFLIPFVRRFLVQQSVKGMQVHGHYRYQHDNDVYEGEWREKSDAELHKRLESDVIEGEIDRPDANDRKP